MTHKTTFLRAGPPDKIPTDPLSNNEPNCKPWREEWITMKENADTLGAEIP